MRNLPGGKRLIAGRWFDSRRKPVKSAGHHPCPILKTATAWHEGQGLWQDPPESDWQDWTWQLKNRLTTAASSSRT